MSQVKLFSSSGGARVAKRSGRQKQKVKKPLKTLAIWLLVILCLEGLYFFCIYTNNSFVKKWRTIYINTAMDTMRHQWLATYFIPKDVIDEVRYEYGLVKAGTVGKESTWGRTDPVPAEGCRRPMTTSSPLDPNVTHETDQPDAEELTQEELESRRRKISIPSSGSLTDLDGDLSCRAPRHAGQRLIFTSTKPGSTTRARPSSRPCRSSTNGVLLLRISGKGYRGVLAVGRTPSRLSIEMATTLGTAGQLSGTIAEAHNGVLAMNANGFLDPNGAGNGGLLAGYTMSNGKAYGDHFSAYAYKRIELHEDDLFYIKERAVPRQ